MRVRLSGFLVVVSLSTPVALAAAQGWVIPRCRPNVPCALPAPGSAVERVSSEVRAELADRVLRYEVEETFVNRGGMVGEADYLFPLPRGAAFQDLKLSINGELVAGETMNAAEARRIYEEIVRRQRDPALVEWMGHGLLRTRIFPIAPGERKTVVVRFQAVAEREGDALRVDYFRGARNQPGLPRPVPVNGVEADDGRRTPEGRVSFTLTYPAGEGLGTAYSPTHSVNVRERGGFRVVEVRGDAREMTLLIPQRQRSEPAVSLLPYATGGEDGFALITLSPPAAAVRTTPRDVTFVLDVSGSMSGRKMEQARAAGRALLATLRPQDRFRLIDFSSDVRTFRDGWTRATRENLRDAEEYLDDLRAEGSTNIAAALDEALGPEVEADEPRPRPGPARDDLYYGDRIKRRDEPMLPKREGRRLHLVLFITDGEPSVGERDPRALAERAARARGDARLFTFGLGADVNVQLIEQLALEGRGTAHFVRPDESPERAVEVVASRLTSPVATNVRVRAEGVRLSRMHPAPPIDIFAGQDLVVLARYEGSGPARLRFDGETADGLVSWTEEVGFPERERGNAFVPRLWATQRIGYLAAEKRKHGASPEIDAEIRELGERYGIPTEFTSYFVKEPGMDVAAMRLQSNAVVGGVAGGRAAPAAAPAPAEARAQRFEAARDAAAKRSAVSLDQAEGAAGYADGRGSRLRRAGSHVFALRDGRWVDARYRGGIRTVKIRAFSEAYFALAERIPELREALAVGDKVVVAGRRVAVEVADDGAERLGERELREIAAQW